MQQRPALIAPMATTRTSVQRHLRLAQRPAKAAGAQHMWCLVAAHSAHAIAWAPRGNHGPRRAPREQALQLMVLGPLS